MLYFHHSVFVYFVSSNSFMATNQKLALFPSLPERSDLQSAVNKYNFIDDFLNSYCDLLVFSLKILNRK